jgi:beta-glucosidase
MLAMLPQLGDFVPEAEPGDAAIIAQPIDFLGVNYYFRTIVHRPPDSPLGAYEVIRPEVAEYTEMGWEVYPQGLYNLLVRLHNDYHIPEMFVTENGAAFADTVNEQGLVLDMRRVSYMREHLLQAHAAITAGVPLAGYFAWSLMDNFEWSYGYSRRFGIVYIDYPTQRRIVKVSGRWYHTVMATNQVGS